MLSRFKNLTSVSSSAAFAGSGFHQTSLDAVAERCAARFGERTKVSNHPYLGAFNVRQWRRFHRLHARHHMKQVARLKEKIAGERHED